MSYIAAGTAAAVVVGGLIQSDASSSAANKQNSATQAGLNETRREFDVSRADSAPYRGAGSTAIQNLMSMLKVGRGPSTGTADPVARESFDGAAYLRANPDVAANSYFSNDPFAHYTQYGQKEGRQGYQLGELQPDQNGPLSKQFSVDDFWKDPVVQLGYQSGLDLGTKALKNASPLTTGLDSGAAMKELTKFGTDYTGQQAGGAQNRFEANKTNTYNRLMGLITGGQTANSVDASTGTSTAATNANLLSSQGNAAAAARIAQGNAQAGGISSIANWWNQQNTLDRLYPRSTPTSSFTYTGGTPSNPAYG